MEPIRPYQGFTLTELLVVFAIIIVILSVVITNQSSFNNSLVLSNTTYDVALAIRSTENFGLGSRVSVGTTNTGYGINFSSATPSVFTIFPDSYPAPNAANCHGAPRGDVNAPDAEPGNCVYDPTHEQKMSAYTLGNGIQVTERCAFTSGAWTCGLSSLDIVFARPNPTPFIRANGSSLTAYSKACLTFTSPQGSTRFVTILSSGQIETNTVSDPNSCHD